MRIVSLLPSTTELACALGLEKQLVGISHECDYPESIRHLPKLTSSIIPHGLSQSEIDAFVKQAVRNGESLYAVDAQRLRDLKPDLILTQGLCDVCAVTPDTIEASLRGIRCALDANSHVVSTQGTSVVGIYEDLKTIARTAGVQQRALELIAKTESMLAAIEPCAEPKRVLGLEWVDPFFSAGHWVPEQISRAGGSSVIGSVTDHSRRLDSNEIVASAPELIIVLCCGFDLEANRRFAQKLYAVPELRELPAIQNQEVWAIDANSFCSRPTLRVADGAELFSFVFKGEAVDASKMCRVQRIV